jgi:hypothetical protein
VTKFTWGKIIQRFEYNFDGQVMEVVKFHPWKTHENGHTILSGQPDLDKVEYECPEIHVGSENLFELILHWIARKHLGDNHDSLVTGVCRALCIGSAESEGGKP